MHLIFKSQIKITPFWAANCKICKYACEGGNMHVGMCVRARQGMYSLCLCLVT